MKKSKFHKDKETLLRTLTHFDSNKTAITDLCEISGSSKNHTFFIQVLLESLCGVIEPDENKRHHLFNGLYSHLIKAQFLNQKIVLDDLLPARRQLATKFTELVKQVHSSITPSIKLDLFPLTDSCTYSNYQKYEQTFKELEVIAKGGFGTVCKARHKVDEVIYAVKKIIFKYRDDSDYLQVIREVKSIATLNHLNVVSYNNAWIEYIQSNNKSIAEYAIEYAESDGSDSSCTEKYSFNSSPSKITKKSKYSSLCNDTNKSSLTRNVDFGVKSHYSTFLTNSGKYPTLECILEGDFSEKNFSSNGKNLRNSSNSIRTLSSLNQFSLHSDKSDLIDSYNESKQLVPCSSRWGFRNMNIKVMLCIQMEFCDCDLRLWLNKRARGEVLPFQMEVFDIFKHILNGVAHIHSKSIIHRDLKPQNIFFSTKDYVMKIGDFGLATLGHCSAGPKDFISENFSSDLGTVPYSAPEQRNKHIYNSKVDIYSLGIILIELLLHFQTQMEFIKTISDILNGLVPAELISQWPQYVNLLTNMVHKDSEVRMSALEILNQPPFLDNFEAERQQFLEEIKDLKTSLTEKNAIIYQLEEQIKIKNRIIIEQNKELEILKNTNYKI